MQAKNKSLKIFNILNLVIKLHNDFQPTMMFIIHVYVYKLQQCKKVLELIISLTNQTYKPTQVLFVVDVFPLEYNVGLMSCNVQKNKKLRLPSRLLKDLNYTHSYSSTWSCSSFMLLVWTLFLSYKGSIIRLLTHLFFNPIMIVTMKNHVHNN
jgi:hypothetical protein